MEAQSLVFKLCSNSPIPSIQNPKVPYFSTSPSSSFSPSSSSSSSNRCPKRISLETHHSFASHKVASNIFKCRNSVEKAESSGDYGGDARTLASNKKKLAVFVSGGGSNFHSIHEATLSGSVCGDIVVLVTNKHDCGGAEYARDKGIPIILFPKMKGKLEEGLSSNDLVTALRRCKVDFILLAGYLKLIPSELIQAYPRCILNIHPSLLPAFGGKGYYGIKVHKGVIASGARYSGPTVHFVDENYDTGRILAQRVVPVLANDTPEELAARVLQEEHKMYVEVVEALCEDRIIWREDGVPLIRSKQNPNDFS